MACSVRPPSEARRSANGCCADRRRSRLNVGTTVEKGKQQIKVDGKTYLLEVALRADFAFVHAFLVDYMGNLGYALTARNFDPVVAMAAGC